MNALSIAKLGIGFGALAVASIGLLGTVPDDAASGVHRLHANYTKTEVVKKEVSSYSDDDELLLIVMNMLGDIL